MMMSGSRPGGRRYQISLVVILSAWLGVSLFVWYSANVTFGVLSVKKNPGISKRFSKIPEGPREKVLKRTAGEINRGMFRGWNRLQLAAGALVFGMMMFGGQLGGRFEGRSRMEIFLAFAALAIVVSHVFWLGPGIEETGRALGSPGEAGAAASRRFGLYHGIYVVSDLIKAGFLGGLLLIVSRKIRSPDAARPPAGGE